MGFRVSGGIEYGSPAIHRLTENVLGHPIEELRAKFDRDVVRVHAYIVPSRELLLAVRSDSNSFDDFPLFRAGGLNSSPKY